jgi:hypothetical protein
METEVSAKCIHYGNGRLPAASELSGEERCDTVAMALDDLYALITAIRNRADFDNIDERLCVGMTREGMELMISDVVCPIWSALNELETEIGALEARAGKWGAGACRRASADVLDTQDWLEWK